MPLFTGSSPYDADVERATSELNVEENTSLVREICDKVKHAPTPGARDCLRSIVKRVNHKVPHVAMQALSLLDTCVQRSGYAFQLEVASADFISECRTLIGSGKAHQKVVQKLKMLLKKWAENEFRSDSNLSSIASLYKGLKAEGHKFTYEEPVKDTSSSSAAKKEEDDLAKAIALSLKESGQQSASKAQSSLYPSAAGVGTYPSLSSATASAASSREPRKVRTLYDFEAAEDNEMTFKAGEIISVLDDSDANWWKGSSWRGEGLFPANFVTADLTMEPEQESYKSRKSVHFHDEVEVKVVEPSVPVLEVDEEKIDAALNLIQNADPTDPQSDSAELLSLEEQCREMGPLIDQELVKIDRQHNSLTESNTKLMEAFQLYHTLMRDLPTYGYVSSAAGIKGSVGLTQQPPMYPGQTYAPGPAGHIPPGLPSMADHPAGQSGALPHAASYGNMMPAHQQALHDPNMYRSNSPYALQNIAPAQQPPASYSQHYSPYAVNPSGPGGGYTGGGEVYNSGAEPTGAPETLQYMQQPMTAQSLL